MEYVFSQQLLELAYHTKFSEFELRNLNVIPSFTVARVTADEKHQVIAANKYSFGNLKYSLQQVCEELCECEAYHEYPCFHILDAEQKIIFRIGYLVAKSSIRPLFEDFSHVYRTQKRTYSDAELFGNLM